MTWTCMQKQKKKVEIQGQTPRKLEQQQMISFFSFNSLLYNYGLWHRKMLFYQQYHLSQ